MLNYSPMTQRSLTLSSARLVAAGVALALVAAACGDDSADLSASAVTTYSEGVHAAYSASLDSATTMDSAIDTFLEEPSDETLAAARSAWLEARNDYGPTEAFRFYGGPIDDEETGTEGLINAWPLDEAYIDYVDGSPEAGIINDEAGFPEITAELLTSLNEEGGESNISTGWHAIEFLLWGQDLSADGPGDRPASDYSSEANADRRGTYLATASDLLLVHLNELVDAWDADGDNYRADFEALETDEALRRIITGVGELSRGELAGERMNVAYAERSQEDEHSCFSDNTHNDIINNAAGIEMVLSGNYPGGVSGTSIIEVVAATDEDLATQLEEELAATKGFVAAIPAPFDQHLVEGVSDDEPGRVAVLAGIESLEGQTDTIVAAAEVIGVTINVS